MRRMVLALLLLHSLNAVGDPLVLPRDFRVRCFPRNLRFKPDCLVPCERAGREGRALDEVLPLDALLTAGTGSHATETFAAVCSSRWQELIPQEALARLSRCNPRRDVIQYALELRLTHLRKTRGKVPNYVAPDLDGTPPVVKGSMAASKRAYINRHLALLAGVLDCPLISDAEGVRTVALELRDRAREKLVAIEREAAEEVERATRRAESIARIRAELAPLLRGAVGCPRCSVDAVWEAHEYAEAICGAIQSRAEAVAELARLRRYGARHGVVDLSDLKDQSDAIREAEDSIRGNRSEFLRVTKRVFSPGCCRNLPNVAERLEAASNKVR